MPQPAPHAVAAHILAPEVGPQNQVLSTAITSEICGSRTLGVGYVAMTGRHHSAAHQHRHSDIVVTVLTGTVATLYGDQLQHVAIHRSGDSVFIPAGIPHAAVNVGDDVVHAVETRTDPMFNADVEPLPDLDAIVSETATRIQAQHEAGLLQVRPDDCQAAAPAHYRSS